MNHANKTILNLDNNVVNAWIFLCFTLPSPNQKLYCCFAYCVDGKVCGCPKMEDFFDVLINKIKKDDFYALLGCDELASTDQINAEFRQRAKLLHPDKNPGDLNMANMFER